MSAAGATDYCHHLNTDAWLLFIFLSQLYSQYAQILLKVMGDVNNMGQVLSIEPVSDNFHMGNYNAAVELMNGQYRDMFI